VKKRIEELQQEVGAIHTEVDVTSARLLELRADRRERRAKSLGTLQRQWGAVNLQRPEVTAELATHARRVARLKRAKEVAGESDNDSAKKRAAKLLVKENRRHEAAMKQLVPARPEPPASTTSHP
jgi:chromosome segregation ATPase